ncbi:unnamed protein product [Auanema sp. JU1783]|nr:unnamed protein product [Auanema sp. JU1783]
MGWLEAVCTAVVRYFFQFFWTSLTAVHLLKDRLLYRNVVTKAYPKPKCLEGWCSHFIQLEGVTLHYVQSGQNEKPLLLMIHGFPEFWYSWRYQLKEFQRDYRCVAIDMRGYNLSEKPIGVENYCLDILANDIQLVIRKLGYQRAIVMAHDWGAIVAWQTAMMFPEVIEKLVICNVPHPKAYEISFKQLLKSWYIFMFQSPYIPEWSVANRDFRMLNAMFRGRKGGLKNRQNFTEEDLQAWRYVFSQEGALTPPINFYRALFSAPSKFRTSELIQPPVLIVWGTGDPFLTKESAKKSVQFCRSAQLYLLEGISHWVQQDEPQKVNARIRKFLDENSKL